MSLRASLLASLAASVAHAGAWTQGRGHGYAKLSTTAFFADQRFDASGEARPLDDATFLGEGFARRVTGGRVREHAAWLYGEAGVAERVDLLAKIGWRASDTRFQCSGPCSDNSTVVDNDDVVHIGNAGLGDGEIGAKVRVLHVPVVSLALSVAAPTYSNDLEVLRLHDQNFFNDRSPLGTGSIDVEGRALVGLSLGRGWLGAEAGLRARTKGYADLAGYLVQGGAPIAWRLRAALGVGGFVPVGDGSRRDAHEPPREEEVIGAGKVIFPSRESAHKLLPSIAVDLPLGFALELGGQWVFAGKRTNAGWGLEAGISYRR
ncbi:MAG: hypothetical protein AABZ30_03505 [Myxococcota bacterium]